MSRLLAMFAVIALVLVGCAGVDDDGADAPAPDDGPYSVEQQPDDAQASFVSPADGDTVSSPITVELSADGVDLAASGAPMVGEGHLHVVADIGCYDSGEIIPGPSDEAEADGNFHLGDGSDAREIDVEPGTHDLCVQLADGVHTAFGQTETITVTVE